MATSSNSKNATRNARWRTIHNAQVQSMTDEVNARRAVIGLGSVSIKFPHLCPFKGGKKPSYNPPAELLATMTKEQLSLWKKKERRKRKAIKQRDNRRRKNAIEKGLEEQLSSLPPIKVEKTHRSESKPVTKAAVKKEPHPPILQVQVRETFNTSLSNNDTDETLVADPYVESNTDAALGSVRRRWWRWFRRMS